MDKTRSVNTGKPKPKEPKRTMNKDFRIRFKLKKAKIVDLDAKLYKIYSMVN